MRFSIYHPLFLIGCGVILGSLSGCAIRIQHTGASFDKVVGKGPLALMSSDETQPSQQFFREHLGDSEALRHLVRESGTPEALSVEREFLQPTRLKLFYASRGQMYVVERHDGKWLVIGAEPISSSDKEALAKQSRTVDPDVLRPIAKSPIISSDSAPSGIVAPVSFDAKARERLSH